MDSQVNIMLVQPLRQPTEVSAHDSLVYHCDIYQQGQLQREDGPLRQVMD